VKVCAQGISEMGIKSTACAFVRCWGGH